MYTVCLSHKDQYHVAIFCPVEYSNWLATSSKHIKWLEECSCHVIERNWWNFPMWEGWDAFRKIWVKVRLTPKYSFTSINLCVCLNALRLFPFFNPYLDFLKAVKVTKSGHHLLHDQASKGYGSIPGLTSQTSLHACFQRLTTMQIGLLYQTSLKRRSVFRTGAKIYFSEKIFWD